MARVTLTVAGYTGNYQAALRPSSLELGDLVRLAQSYDEREWSDVKQLVPGGATLAWVSWMPRKRMDVFRVGALKVKGRDD